MIVLPGGCNISDITSFQATVYILEKLEVLLTKASEEEVKADILPMIFQTLESNSIPGQVSEKQFILYSFVTICYPPSMTTLCKCNNIRFLIE